MSEELEFELPDELKDIDSEPDDLDLDMFDNDEGDNIEEQQPEEQPEEPKAKQEKMVPLSALEAERKKWKEKLEREKKNLTPQKTESFDEEAFVSKETQRFIKLGYDEESARMFAEDKLESKREIESLKKLISSNSKDLTSQKRNVELDQLKADEFYADIEDVRDEVEALAEKTGLSMRQAYNALYADTKLKGSKADQQRLLEQKVLRDMQRKEAASVDTSANGANTVPVQKVKLTAEQAQMAKLAGMTPAEYYRLTKVDTLDKYRKTKKK